MGYGGDSSYGIEGGGNEALGLGTDDGLSSSSTINYSLNMEPSTSSSSIPPINSSNIGFQLLKKHGWKEGTGLGISEQGRLEPVEAHVKKNKRGLGAEVIKKRKEKAKENADKHSDENENKKLPSKRMTKKMKKMVELEERLKEKEIERAFYREFWPENV